MEFPIESLKNHGLCLGSGEFGRVFEATLEDQPVVYKIFKHAVHPSLFFKEIEIMKLLSHPNIIQLIGFSHNETTMAIIMERAKGISLYHALLYHDFTSVQKNKISVEVIRTICYLHSQNILHRDIKPENIIVDMQSLNLKFIDFGLALNTKSSNQKIKGIAGTHGYMAPEICRGEKYSFPADIYSFGMTLFFIWTQEHPVRPSQLYLYMKRIPRIYEEIIFNCTSNIPEVRFSALYMFSQLKTLKFFPKKKLERTLWDFFSCHR